MQVNPWNFVLPIFIATLPLLFVLVYNLIEVKTLKASMENKFLRMDSILMDIQKDTSGIKERLATLEERDRIRLN